MSERKRAKKTEHNLQHKLLQTEEQPVDHQYAQAPALDIFNTVQQNPSVASSAQILHLQRTIGNQAILSMFTPAKQANDTDVMRLFGFGKKKDPMKESLLGSDDFSDDMDEDTQTKVSKLRDVGDKLKLYYDIHKNYERFAEYLGNKAWNIFRKVWKYVNKALGIIEKFDPSGITAAIKAVSKLVLKIANYVTEAVLLSDKVLVEQLTPLLPKSLTLGTIKDAVQEALDFKDLVTGAIDAVTEL